MKEYIERRENSGKTKLWALWKILKELQAVQ